MPSAHYFAVSGFIGVEHNLTHGLLRFFRSSGNERFENDNCPPILNLPDSFKALDFVFLRSVRPPGIRCSGRSRILPDGRVEVFVQGKEASVKNFYNDLLAGPVYARVENIEELVIDTSPEYKSFLILR